MLMLMLMNIQGGSLPGKAFEQGNYAGGVGAYVTEIREALPGLKGFNVVKTPVTNGSVSNGSVSKGN